MIIAAWLITLVVALMLSSTKGVPSPMHILFREVTGNLTRDWYWVGAVLPASLVAIVAARSLRERTVIVIAAVAVGIIGTGMSLFFYDWHTAIYVGAKYCALFGVFAVAWQAPRPGGIERLLIVVMFSTYLAIRLSYLPLTYMVRTDTFDLYTYAFDASFGFDVATFLFFLYHTIHWLDTWLNGIYVFVLMLPLSLYAAQTYRRDPNTAPMLRVFLAATVLGFLCYIIFPVSGPLYFFGPGEISLKLLTAPPRIVEFHASLRNAMPSVHFAVALLMAINVPRSLRWVKIAFVIWCALTFMATMGNGEHYFADLVAALPFVCAVQGFCLWLNAPKYRWYLFASLRSVALFAGFLIFLIVEPQAMRTPPVSCAVLALLVAHFLWERHGWWQADAVAGYSHDTNHVVSPLALTSATNTGDPCIR